MNNDKTSQPSSTSQSQPSSLTSKRLKSMLYSSLLGAGLITGLSACTSLQTSQSNGTVNSKSTPSTEQAHQGRYSKQTDTQFTADDSRHEYLLDNGLKVIIKEDHRSPVVMTQIWYRVGSTDEPEDKGGISHILEHMMFKGTPKVSGADFDRLVAKFGGNHNAFTSYDFTGYYEMFPVNRLALALELESDRMTNLSFDSDEFVQEFKQERNVVMEERRQRTDDNPLARSFEKFRKLALPNSPKGESVIGPMDEIGSIEIDDLEQWYKTWYAPNNATLVIVGDVDPEQTMAKVDHYFGHLQRKQLPQRPSVQQKGWRGYQQQQIQESVNVPTLLMAFNVPSLHSAKVADLPEQEAYNLLMLQFVLDGGLAARFEKNLVREQGILASVGTDYNLYERGDGLFFIQATPREGVSLEQAQQAIIKQIDALKSANISQQELDRARNNVVKGFVFAQDSVSGQAYTIGNMQVRGLDDRLITTLNDQLAKVSSQDINKTADKYLVNNNLTVMHIEPATNAATAASKTSR
ncbi:M16 family metallopeptidase [Psychrobacter sp. FDAARGOS_221]|uniref:M16 family metallopeptidase n=1 Tax=Psychrobacter sp. FDAARGOS_221 TaxID=1975705 RepID=UPI000BB5833C|nr:pitrilysin family protein [Psychrobacter sp. FDAARGOS_221]PNK61388.1 insulinase family protein [Psychrobacter sp. FDAARGOS_221]